MCRYELKMSDKILFKMLVQLYLIILEIQNAPGIIYILITVKLKLYYPWIHFKNNNKYIFVSLYVHLITYETLFPVFVFFVKLSDPECS